MSDTSWPHFTRAELECPCGCGEMKMDDDFMHRMEIIRVTIDRPLYVTSGYRCPDYNDTISNTGRNGPHTTGKAVDIAIYGEDAHRLTELAYAYLNVRGLGFKQHGDYAGRFIHLDTLYGDGFRPRIWTYDK